MQLPIHVLSLPRATGRRNAISAALQMLGLEFELNDGPDAAAFRLSDLEARFGKRVGRGMSPSTPGDMACTLGHVGIWQRIARAQQAAAIVLEDDATFGRGLVDWVQDGVVAMMSAQGAGLLRLEARPGERLVGRRLGDGLWRLTSPAFGSAGYCVTRDAAEWLLGRFGRPGRPVDHILWGPLSPARSALMPLVISPAEVSQDLRNFPSHIAAERQRLGTQRYGLRDRAGRALTTFALMTGQAETIRQAPGRRGLSVRNEHGTSL